MRLQAIEVFLGSFGKLRDAKASSHGSNDVLDRFIVVAEFETEVHVVTGVG